MAGHEHTVSLVLRQISFVAGVNGIEMGHDWTEERPGIWQNGQRWVGIKIHMGYNQMQSVPPSPGHSGFLGTAWARAKRGLQRAATARKDSGREKRIKCTPP